MKEYNKKKHHSYLRWIAKKFETKRRRWSLQFDERHKAKELWNENKKEKLSLCQSKDDTKSREKKTIWKLRLRHQEIRLMRITCMKVEKKSFLFTN